MKIEIYFSKRELEEIISILKIWIRDHKHITKCKEIDTCNELFRINQLLKHLEPNLKEE